MSTDSCNDPVGHKRHRQGVGSGGMLEDVSSLFQSRACSITNNHKPFHDSVQHVSLLYILRYRGQVKLLAEEDAQFVPTSKFEKHA